MGFVEFDFHRQRLRLKLARPSTWISNFKLLVPQPSQLRINVHFLRQKFKDLENDHHFVLRDWDYISSGYWQTEKILAETMMAMNDFHLFLDLLRSLYVHPGIGYQDIDDLWDKTYERLEQLLFLEKCVSDPVNIRMQTLQLHGQFIPFTEYNWRFFYRKLRPVPLETNIFFKNAAREYTAKRKPRCRWPVL